MSILTTELLNFNSANMPETDAATSGGAIDLLSRPSLTQWAANNIAQILSDGADTRTVTVTGRSTAGAIQSDPIVANGTTPVSGALTQERVLKIVTTTNASRIITVKEAAGGTIRATIPANETTSRILFYDSASGSGITIRYEKVFWLNNNGTLTLSNATVTLTADPTSRYRIGCDTAVNATVSVANRLTAPSSVVFVDDSVAQSVPGNALTAGSKIGVWIEQNLPANDPAAKTTFTTQLAGTSI